MTKRWYLIFLIVVVTFTLIATASFVYVYLGSKQTGVNFISPSPTPLVSPIPSPTVTTSEDTTPAQVSEVKIYLVAVGDDGTLGEKIGCGDSLVAVTRKITPTTTPLTAAVNELLSIRTRELGRSGLYNSLYQSALKLDSATVDQQGLATVKLSGKVQLGGVCDDPRFKEQIIKTVSQFPTVKKTSVLINGEPLDQVVSERG